MILVRVCDPAGDFVLGIGYIGYMGVHGCTWDYMATPHSSKTASHNPAQPLAGLRTARQCDALLGLACRALATLTATLPAKRPLPRTLSEVTGTREAADAGTDAGTEVETGAVSGADAGVATPAGIAAAAYAAEDLRLSEEDRQQSVALMRVNHVGEVCAQALYEGQALAAHDDALKRFFRASAQEEADHLAWTRARLEQLRARPSLLNPLWYAGSLGIGYLAGRLGEATSLGFMRETERQVEAHLAGHMQRLPPHDTASRAIVHAMQRDEAAHAQQAALRGARELPGVVKVLMRGTATLMTATARYL